jgi:anti-anti-sigma factor
VDENYFGIHPEAASVDANGAPLVRVRLSGEFDAGASDELRQVLLEVVDHAEAATVVVDLEQVAFIDSEAIGALIDGLLTAEQAGIGFRAVNARGIVKRNLTVVDMLERFDPAADPSGDATGDA